MGGLWKTLGSAVKGGVVIVGIFAIVGLWFAYCQGGVS